MCYTSRVCCSFWCIDCELAPPCSALLSLYAKYINYTRHYVKIASVVRYSAQLLHTAPFWIHRQPCFYTNAFLIEKQGQLWCEFKYWLLQDSFTAAWGWTGADLPCSPHLLWLAVLFTPTPVGNVTMGHRLAHTYGRDVDTASHVLVPLVFFGRGPLSRRGLGANGVTNLTLNFYSHLSQATVQDDFTDIVTTWPNLLHLHIQFQSPLTGVQVKSHVSVTIACCQQWN